MSQTFYRILLNNQEIPIPENFLPSKDWDNIINRFTARYSGSLTLQSRNILQGNSDLFMAGLTNKTGYIQLKNKDQVITPWQTIAEIKER